MYLQSLTCFVILDQEYDEELWYSNFLNEVSKYIHWKDTVVHSAISVKWWLAITLYFLASTAEYRIIANLFGVSRSCVCVMGKRCLQSNNKQVVAFHGFSKWRRIGEIINNYEQRWGFPMWAGTIDWTNIPIIAPFKCHAEYVNRKSYHSIIM